MEEKWKLIGGRVYRLADVFNDLPDAVRLAKKLKEKHHVFLSRTSSEQWCVYWRSRAPDIECSARYLRAS